MSVLEESAALVKPSVPWQFKDYYHIHQAWDAGWYAGISRAIATVRCVRTNEPEPVMYYDSTDTQYQAQARMHGDMAGYQAYIDRRKQQN